MGTIVVTGAAGFLGSQLVPLLTSQHEVLLIDNLNTSYGGSLVSDRVEFLGAEHPIIRLDLSECEPSALDRIVESADLVVHLAAWAGVRASLERSNQYFQNNVVATRNLLRACQQSHTPILVTSSSSVYGDVGQAHPCDEEVANGTGLRSPYAVTKWLIEEWVRCIASVAPPVLIVRPFSIYGPWGRPDMAYFSFARSMLREEPINLFGDIGTKRDFTYVDDAIFYLTSLIEAMLVDPHGTVERFDIGFGVGTVNLCNGDPRPLRDVLEGLEAALQMKAEISLQPGSPLDLRGTHGDPSRLHAFCGRSLTPLEEGLLAFAEWITAFRGSARDW